MVIVQFCCCGQREGTVHRIRMLQLDQQPMPVESGRQTGVPLLPPAPETEQGARKEKKKSILTELVLPVCVTQPGHGEEEHGEAGLSKAISVS